MIDEDDYEQQMTKRHKELADEALNKVRDALGEVEGVYMDIGKYVDHLCDYIDDEMNNICMHEMIRTNINRVVFSSDREFYNNLPDETDELK